MSKRCVALAIIVGFAVLALSAPATGVAKKKHQCTNRARGAIIEQSEGYPSVVGSTAVLATLEEARCDGKVTRGAGEEYSTVTGADPATGIEFKTELVAYYGQGAIRSRTTAKATPQSGGRVTGELKITGGTGFYRGATGGGPFSISGDPGGVVIAEGKGTLSY